MSEPPRSPSSPSRFRGLPRLASAAWRSGDPQTLTFALPGHDDAVSRQHARAVADVALRVGEALLVMGTPASDVAATALRVLHTYGVTSAHVDVTFTAITVSVDRGLDQDPLTVMRVIRQRSLNHSRLQNVQRLIDRVTTVHSSARPGIDEVREELVRALRAPRPYRNWVVALGGALMAAGIVVTLGGGAVSILLAALSAAIVTQVVDVLERADFPVFYNQVLGAAIPTSIAVGLAWLQLQGAAPISGADSPSLVAISGIVVLLAGMTVVGAAQDALGGYYVTASARGLEVVVVTVGIAVGIGLVLTLTTRAGLPVTITPQVASVTDPLPILVAAVFVGTGYALSTRTAPRTVLLAGLTAPLVYAAYLPVAPLGLPVGFAVAVPAILAGALGFAVHHRLQVPEQVVTLGAIIMLLPGLAVYRGLDQLISAGDPMAGIEQLFAALGTGLGLAAGVSVGSFLARRLVGPDRIGRRVLRARQRR